MKKIIIVFGFIMLFSITGNELRATSEVYTSGSTWIAETDGNTVYSGGSFFDAVNSACYNEGSGTINIWNSGSSGPGNSDIYAIFPQSNQTLDFHGNTIDCNGNELVVGIRADNKSYITVRNVNVTGWPRYGFWFTQCHNVTFTDITMSIDNNQPVGLGIRYSGRDGGSSNLTINGSIDIRSTGHCIETYTVNGVSIGDVTVRSRNGCGVLLNNSQDSFVGNVTAIDCNTTGHYAGFRTANDNGTARVSSVYARNCGRGIYIMGSSADTEIESVNIQNCQYRGITTGSTGNQNLALLRGDPVFFQCHYAQHRRIAGSTNGHGLSGSEGRR